MVGRPRAFSISEAWVFIATSAPPVAAPKRKALTRRKGKLPARIGSGNSTVKAKVSAGGRHARAEAAEKRAGERHPGDGADRHDQENEAEHGRIEIEPGADERDVHRPEAEADADDEEGDRDGDPGAVQLVEPVGRQFGRGVHADPCDSWR